jgi:hypothetical protein
MVKTIRKIGNFIKSLFKGLWNAFELRDIFVFGGLFSLGYGLWLLRPWLGFAVPGLLLFVLGLLWPVFLNFTARRGK